MEALLSAQASAMRGSAAGRAASSSKCPATITTREDRSLVPLPWLSFSHLFRVSCSQAFASLISCEPCQSCSASCRCLSTTASVIFLPLQRCFGLWVLKDSPVGCILPPAHSGMGTRWRDICCNSLLLGLCGGEKRKPISPQVPVKICDSFLPSSS